MSEISVNSESVRNGVSNIEKALEAIKKSQSNIDSAVDNLEKGIGSFDFQSIMSKLSSTDARSGEIIRKSDDYISDAKAAEETLSNIYDDIYGNQSLDASSLLDFDGNIELSSEDISLSSSEINSILTLLYQTNHAEDAAGLALQMLDSYDGISDADKEYIMDQMAEGNIRAAVQYILTLMAKQDLEALKAKNNAKIKELNIKKGELLLEYSNDDGIPESPEMRAIDDEIARLEREISAQERVVRQYERANREWEYDKYFNKIGTEEFDIVVEIDFYNAFQDYANKTGKLDEAYIAFVENGGNSAIETNSILASLLLNDSEDDSFINWLKSDECDLENKDQLLDYYNKNFDGTQNETDIRRKIYQINATDRDIELTEHYKYKYLTDDEKKVLLYLYLTEGDKAAQQFVEDFKDTINKRWGYNKANEIFTNIITASENGVGVLGANWEGIKIGTEGWFSRIGAIFDSSGVNTGEEYAQMYVNSLLASLSYLTVIDASDVDNYIKDPSSLQKIKERQKNGEQITYADILAETGQITPEQAEGLKLMLKDERVAKFMNDSETSVLGSTHREWLKRFYNAGVSTGAMLPSMVISMATSGLLGAGGVAPAAASTAGKYAGVAAMFGYSYSANKSGALRDGRGELEAIVYSLLAAGGEGASEYLIGGVPFISKGSELLKISSDSSLGWNVVKGVLNMLVIDPGQEILQEEVEDNVLDPLFQLIAYGDTDYTFSLEEFVETAITTYISTVEMHGLSVVSTVSEINLANLNKNTEVAVVEFNGQEIEISASDLLSCMDGDGNLDAKSIAEIIKEKAKIDSKKESTVAEKYDSFKHSDVTEGEKAHYTDAQMEEMSNRFDALKSDNYDENAINAIKNTYLSQMKKGNPFIGRIASAVASLLESGKITSIEVSDDTKRSKYDSTAKNIQLSTSDLKKDTPFHELWHALHFLFDSRVVGRFQVNFGQDGLFWGVNDTSNTPTFNKDTNSYMFNGINYTDTMQRTRAKLNDSNNLFWKLNQENENHVQLEMEALAREKAEQDLKIKNEKNGTNMTYEDGVKLYEKNIEKAIEKRGLKEMLDRNKDYMKAHGIEYDSNTELTPELLEHLSRAELSRVYQNQIVDENGKNNCEQLARQKDSQDTVFSAVKDIADAISGGEYSSQNKISSGHGSQYYGADLNGTDLQNNADQAIEIANQINESVAQFGAILSVSPDAISTLQEMFGEEFCNMILNEMDRIIANATST